MVHREKALQTKAQDIKTGNCEARQMSNFVDNLRSVALGNHISIHKYIRWLFNAADEIERLEKIIDDAAQESDVFDIREILKGQNK